MSQTGRLRAITVRGLFGASDDQELRITLEAAAPTVITGANGSGKSTILRLVNAASAGDVDSLANAPLSYFRLDFNDLEPFSLRRQGDVAFSLGWGSHGSEFMRATAVKNVPAWALDALNDSESAFSPEERLERAAMYAGVPVGERQEVIAFLRESDFLLESYQTPVWHEMFSELFPVLYVTDQRLVVEKQERRATNSRRFREQRRPSRLAVEAASTDIASQMRQLDGPYARASLMGDRQFPRQLISTMNQSQPVAFDDLQQLIDTVDNRRARLREVGLLEADDVYLPELTPQDLQSEQVKPVISLFLETALKKLDVFTELEAKLSSFKAFLDERFAPKSATLSRQGLRFILPTGEAIRPSQLSSGEQQMLVLGYEILFRAQPRTLVLVDEPEISLHVKWQATLVDRLKEMGRASDLQFLLATHSPVLLGSHPELERPLDELI